MKKRKAAIVIFDIMMCLLLLFAYGYKYGRTAPVSGQAQNISNRDGNKEEDREIKKIALTFDDGPHAVYTEELLDGLKERGVKATFFVTGEHVELHPEIGRAHV